MKKFAFAAVVLVASSPAWATGSPVDQYLAAVDLSTVAASIAALGVIIVGMALASKGINIVKGLISKA